jgi:hypothetical protein
MKALRLICLFILLTNFVQAQQVDFELNKIKFNGLAFFSTKDVIVKTFGQPQITYPHYTCGFHGDDQSGGPYYQLKYKDFNFIGSDKEEFILEKVSLDPKGKIKIMYADKELSGLTTKTDFIKILGDVAKQHFEKYPEKDSLLLFSKGSDEGAIFTFKSDRLIKFEYWSPC